MLLSVILVIIVFIIGSKVKAFMSKYDWFVIGDIEPDEELDYYPFALGEENREKLKKAEEIRQSKWGMKKLLDETYEQFNGKEPIRSRFDGASENLSMKGVYCYNILSNPHYCQKFSYCNIICDEQDRKKAIIKDKLDKEPFE